MNKRLRAAKTNLASFTNTVKNGTDQSLLKQQKWQRDRVDELRLLLDNHEKELKTVETEIAKRRKSGAWKYNPNRDEEEDWD